MPAAGAAAVRRLLAEGAEEIARLPPGRPEAGVSAFNTFKRGVTQASSGREVPPDQLLADLEPKDVIWRFLVGLVQRKPMYRKQVAATVSVLASCRPWLDALRAQEALQPELPEEWAAVLEDAEGRLQEQGEEAASEGEEEEDSPEPGVGRQRSQRQSTTQRALDLLGQGWREIEALHFSAARTDEAIAAFETFQRAVMWVVRSPQKEDDEALEGLQHKDQVLSFIIDFYMRKPLHRLRIASLFVRLLGFDDWRAAILADPSVRAAVLEMTRDQGLAEASSEDSQPAAISIDAAVQEAADKGGVGAVLVRVIAAYDLVPGARAPEELSLHVSVALGDALRRTDTVVGDLNPRWMSAPFLLEVPSWETPLRFEVLDSDFDKDESFGSLELPIAELPTEPGSGFSRHALRGTGELELEVLLRRPAEDDAGADEAADASFCASLRSRRSSSVYLVAGGDQPAVLRTMSMTTNGGRIICPAGHEVDKLKEAKRRHAFLFGGRKERPCGICFCIIPPDAARWRCSFQCDFKVCASCYEHGGRLR